MKDVVDALAMFRSVIRSGEPWTDQCQERFDRAMAALAKRDAGTEPCKHCGALYSEHTCP